MLCAFLDFTAATEGAVQRQAQSAHLSAPGAADALSEELDGAGAEQGKESNMNKIITISREFGSGGRTIGKETAEKLGIKCYDAELISKIAEKSGFAESYVRDNHDGNSDKGWLDSVLRGRDYYGETNQDYLWKIQKQIILELADKESCVIVGRCADYILRERPGVLKVFIHASLASRAERVVRVYGESDEAPEKRLKDKDKRRKSYYHFYTDMEWGKAEHYDVCLDSGTIGIERCVDVIAALYKSMKEE